ncbi:fructosamine kinase family protein [Thiosulfativibrio zosterae]|uniref:Fructosamine kinase family protein n=1 Tax=Thiosulfativibrio zosterae TaxID=2675053 RepID=A0A6F8PQR3_9GAMM|nr:fructosamine kinase family protein [Thiosulfativibrio zosterae]BBP44368.1 fructosamine kinase family protein [Thiosulfativibrio zosterae]
MNWQVIANSIQQDLNQEFNIISAAKISGGDIHQAFKIHTHSTLDHFRPEQNFFIKINTAETFELFAAEAFALKTLKDSLSCQVPKVIHLGQNTDQAWLVLEYFQLTSKGDDFQRGKDLALLHHTTQATFGFDQDNFIGLTPQINTPNSDWIVFYGQQRLGYQLALAQANGISAQVFNLGQKLISALPKFFETYHPKASLLHGDLWSGNSAFDEDGEAIFYDPVSYYGDRETDLAMTELFGGFSPAFYKGYNTVFPLDKGYELRKPLYQLYHLLNHFNLFGGHYEQQSLECMQSLLSKVS